MAKTGRKNRKGGGRPSGASESYKRHVAFIVLKQKLTLDVAAAQFGVSRQTVNRWVHQYYDDIERSNVIEIMNADDKYPVIPRKKVAEYESKLHQAELKITALETMIELAETTYKIAIRKNSGTKQQA